MATTIDYAKSKIVIIPNDMRYIVGDPVEEAKFALTHGETIEEYYTLPHSIEFELGSWGYD